MHKKQFAVALMFAFALAVSTAVAISVTSKTATIRVKGMHCGSCATSVEKALKATDGVEEARVSFDKSEAWVKFDDQKVTLARLHEVINGTGFKAVEEKEKASR